MLLSHEASFAAQNGPGELVMLVDLLGGPLP